MLFIPSPNVAEDHQTKNAMSVSKKNAAILIKEHELNKLFDKTFVEIVQSEDRRQLLSDNIRELGRPNATKDIIAEIEKLLR